MESKASHQSFAVESWKRHTTGIYISQHGKVKNPLFNIYIVYATSMWGGNLKLRYNVCIILFNLLQLSFNHHFSAFWTTICKGHGLGKLSMAIDEAWPISRFRLGLLFGALMASRGMGRRFGRMGDEMWEAASGDFVVDVVEVVVWRDVGEYVCNFLW